jgi:hypothetical protein
VCSLQVLACPHLACTSVWGADIAYKLAGTDEEACWGNISDGEEEDPAAGTAANLPSDGKDELETDPKRLKARQLQIDFGKITLGYEWYLQAVPK